MKVLLGPARCGKTHRLLGQYLEALAAGPRTGGIGRTRWLAPTSRAAFQIRERLVDAGLDGCLAPGVTTFDELADEVLAATPHPPRRLKPLAERSLLRRVVQSALERKALVALAEPAGRRSFIDLLAEHIHELQRRNIRPQVFARATGLRLDRAQHQELALLYAEYDGLLASHRLCNSESRQAAARDVLAADRDGRILGGLELVAVDGFTDFTAVQHNLVEQLARRAERLCLTLPDDAERRDLFAKSLATLAELRGRHPQLDLERMPARESGWPAMDHLAQNLFRHPRDIPEPPPAALESLARFEIVEAASGQDEIVQLARVIKQRLLDRSARPSDIVVVFRHLQDAAPRVRAVFDEFGIPYSLEAGLPLITSGVVRTVLDLLRLAAEDWPYRRVVRVATNNLLRAFSRPDRSATDWLVRDLQIAKGRNELLERVARLAVGQPASADGASENSPALFSHRDRQHRAAVIALPVLRALAAALDDLPAAATPTNWIDALTACALRLGIPIAAEADNPEHNAWQRITEHFASVERLAAWLGEPPPPLDRRGVLDLLADLAEHERLPRPHDDVGRVRIVSAVTARTVEARHLFLAGMSEQAFPSAERMGRFYREAEYAVMARRTGARPHATDAPLNQRAHDEMLLFYEVVTRATERLTISYPALDDKAQMLPPSPYVTELEQTFGRNAIRRQRALRPSPSPPDAPPLSPTDWRILAVEKALANPPDPAPLAALFSDSASAAVAASLEAALRVIDARDDRGALGSAEGVLKSDAARARLARRYGPDHDWSPSQFETFAGCPFRFFLDEVLRLEPLGELVLESDARRRGTLYHQALAKFHRDRPTMFRAGQLADAAAQEQFVRELANVVDALVRATPYTGLEAALAELDRRFTEQWAPRYYGELAKYRDGNWPPLDEPLAPTHFEWRFGPPRSEDTEHEDAASTSQPLELDLGTEKIRVTGRIDRIDVGRRGEKTVFNVIDYKSGKRPSIGVEKIATGERLQPALYVLAAQMLLFGQEQSVPLWAGYWSLRNGVNLNPRYSLCCSTDGATTTDDWQNVCEAVKSRIRFIVEAVRGGKFPVASRDEDCTRRCDFATICRIAQVRSLAKDRTWLEHDALGAAAGEALLRG